MSALIKMTGTFAWGGRRSGAGRKPGAGKRCVPHRSREPFSRVLPVHVTIRMAKNVYNLRSQRAFTALKRAFTGAAIRFDTRIVHFSVQGNHIHLIVESPDEVSLSRAMKGLGVRIARRLNGMMRRTGRVIGDRHHTHVIRSRRAAQHVVRYVRENHRKHYGVRGMWRIGTTTDEFSSWAYAVALPNPQTALLRDADRFS